MGLAQRLRKMVAIQMPLEVSQITRVAVAIKKHAGILWWY